jgi:hypothetical protein
MQVVIELEPFKRPEKLFAYFLQMFYQKFIVDFQRQLGDQYVFVFYSLLLFVNHEGEEDTLKFGSDFAITHIDHQA